MNAATAPSPRLDGCTILVTGAGSGIGRATARLAAAAGATVVVTDVKGHDEVARDIVDAGGVAVSQTLDVADPAAWEAVVASTTENHGRIDGLANVAGIVSTTDTVVDQTEETWDRILAIDLTGTWLGMRAVLPGMIARGGGRVVNVASVAGLIGMPNVAAYSAAKGGVIGLTRQAATEYAAKNIRCNAIAPGVIETAILGDLSDELRRHVIAAIPTGRLGRPEDIGTMAVYLLGSGADFISGQVFAIDGGWTAQ